MEPNNAWPSQWCRSSLFQVMAYYTFGVSHNLIQCNISSVEPNKLQWIMNQYTILFQEDAFENGICKVVAIFFSYPYVSYEVVTQFWRTKWATVLLTALISLWFMVPVAHSTSILSVIIQTSFKLSLKFWYIDNFFLVSAQQCVIAVHGKIHGFMQERRNSISSALELRLSCPYPLKYFITIWLPGI